MGGEGGLTKYTKKIMQGKIEPGKKIHAQRVAQKKVFA